MMPEESTTWLITQGALGIGCMVFAGATYYLKKESERREKEKTEILQSFLKYSQDTTEKVVEALKDSTRSTDSFSNKVEILRGRRE